MFVPFLIVATAIFIAGPIHNEGVGKLIKEKGLKEAASQVWYDREMHGKRVNPPKVND